jgi:hypothetical protein
MVACESVLKLKPDDEWLRPTLLGAAFYAGDVEKSRELADQVGDGPAAWKLETTLADLKLAIPFHDGERAQELAEIKDGLEALCKLNAGEGGHGIKSQASEPCSGSLINWLAVGQF